METTPSSTVPGTGSTMVRIKPKAVWDSLSVMLTSGKLCAPLRSETEHPPTSPVQSFKTYFGLVGLREYSINGLFKDYSYISLFPTKHQ